MDRHKNYDSDDNIYKNLQRVIISSLSFVSALAWNSAFQNFFESSKFFNRGGKWIYAISITIITLLCLYTLEHANNILS